MTTETNTATIDWKDEVTDGFMAGTSRDGLAYREFLNPKSEFLRCQVGIVEWEARDVTPWDFRRNHKRIESMRLFHLLGYGETMDKAKEMADKVLRKAA